MQTTTGSLTLLNAHTEAPQVFWNGIKVEGIKAISVTNFSGGVNRVTLTLPEDPILAEMQAAGITIKRSAS
jgi:hypothetical protein